MERLANGCRTLGLPGNEVINGHGRRLARIVPQAAMDGLGWTHVLELMVANRFGIGNPY